MGRQQIDRQPAGEQDCREDTTAQQQPCLRFGVTGHRPPRLKPTDYATVRKACDSIFVDAINAVASLSDRPGASSTRRPAQQMLLSSALASGADTIAALVARDHGIALTACLPFPADIYATAFSTEEWSEATDLINSADDVIIVADQDASDEHAYEAAGHLVLDRSDIVIAIWDGAPARGRGGTTEILAEAVMRGIPVIHILPGSPHDPVLLWRDPAEDCTTELTLETVPRVSCRDGLPVVINTLCGGLRRP